MKCKTDEKKIKRSGTLFSFNYTQKTFSPFLYTLRTIFLFCANNIEKQHYYSDIVYCIPQLTFYMGIK